MPPPPSSSVEAGVVRSWNRQRPRTRIGEAMTVGLKPETEQLVREELSSGHFRSVDEMIVEGARGAKASQPAVMHPGRRPLRQPHTSARCAEGIDCRPA